MTHYRDPQAPAGRVVFGGEQFIDGVTDDIKIGDETRRLFKSAGIVEVTPEPPAEDAPDEPEKPAPRRRK